MTRSPGFADVTPGPTAETTPATSPPGEKGSGGWNWYLPWMINVSGKFTPQAFTSTTTWPSPGSGSGTSWTTKDDGGPCSRQRTALIAPHPRRSDYSAATEPGGGA